MRIKAKAKNGLVGYVEVDILVDRSKNYSAHAIRRKSIQELIGYVGRRDVVRGADEERQSWTHAHHKAPKVRRRHLKRNTLSIIDAVLQERVARSSFGMVI